MVTMQLVSYQSCAGLPTPNNKFFNKGEWLIEKDQDVIDALEYLRNPLVCPATVTIAPTWNLTQDNRFDDFLFVVKRKKCSLQILSPRFLVSVDPNDEIDSLCRKLLIEIHNSATSCTLDKYLGSLSSSEVHNINTPSTLTSLGLSVGTAEDIKAVAQVLKEKNWKFINLVNLHLSIARCLQPEDFDSFQLFCSARLHLKFFNLTDGDIKWMAKLTLALDKPFTKSHVCIDEIGLLKSQLSLKGVEEMLKTFKAHDSRIEYPVRIETTAIHDVVKEKMSEETSQGRGPRVFFMGSTMSTRPLAAEGKTMDEVHKYKEGPKGSNALRKDELVAGLFMVFVIQFSFFFGVFFKYT